MNNKGFSLIELVMVMAIIGLLSSLILPNFSNINTKSKETAVKSVAHALQVSLESYFLSNGTYPTGTNTHIATLATTLAKSGDLSKTPINPFTQKAYTDKDKSGKVDYTFDASKQLYTINAYGLQNSSIISTITNN